MRSRDYECWIEDLSSSPDGSFRLEERPVPLVRKLSDTSRHARTAVLLQGGQKYVLRWRRLAIYGITLAESEDPFVTCVWVIITLNGKTLGEGLLSDLNNRTKSSVDRITSSSALTGSPLWEDHGGAPMGFTGKLSISFYRSPEVIRRALKDRAYSEPQRAGHSSESGFKGRSASIVRRNPLIFRGPGNPAPTVFNFFVEVVDPEKTPKAIPRQLRHSVSANLEQVISWSKRRSWRSQQPSEDGTVASGSVVSEANANPGADQQPSAVPRVDQGGKGKQAQAPVLPPIAPLQTSRPRASTLKAINGRLIVVHAAAEPSVGIGSSTVDTDYVFRPRQRAATLQTPIVPSQRPSGTTSADTFLSGSGNNEPVTRARRAMSDVHGQAPGRDMTGEIEKLQAARRDLAVKQNTEQQKRALGSNSNETTEQEHPEPSSTATDFNAAPSSVPWNNAVLSPHHHLTPVAEADRESLRGLAVAYRDSLHEDLVNGPAGQSPHFNLAADALTNPPRSPPSRRSSLFHLKGTSSKDAANGAREANAGEVIPEVPSRAMEERDAGGNNDTGTTDGTIASSEPRPPPSPSSRDHRSVVGEDEEEEDTPLTPTAEQLQIYQSKRALITPLEETLRHLQEEEEHLLHLLEVRRLDEYENHLNKKIEQRRRRVNQLEDRLRRNVRDVQRSMNLVETGYGSTTGSVTGTSPVLSPLTSTGAWTPARSVTASLASGKEFSPTKKVSEQPLSRGTTQDTLRTITGQQHEHRDNVTSASADQEDTKAKLTTTTTTSKATSIAPLSEAALALHGSQPGIDELIAARRQLASSLATAPGSGHADVPEKVDERSVLSDSGSQPPSTIAAAAAAAAAAGLRRGGGGGGPGRGTPLSAAEMKSTQQRAPTSTSTSSTSGTASSLRPLSPANAKAIPSSSPPPSSPTDTASGWQSSPTLGLSNPLPTLRPDDFSPPTSTRSSAAAAAAGTGQAQRDQAQKRKGATQKNVRSTQGVHTHLAL